MLNTKHRLSKTKDVKKVFLQGRGFFNPHFNLKFLRTPSQPSRFTVVVSSKVAKRAVDRNRLKRVLREAVRQRLLEFPPADYVISVKFPAAALPPGQVREKFTEFLNSFLRFKKT